MGQAEEVDSRIGMLLQGVSNGVMTVLSSSIGSLTAKGFEALGGWLKTSQEKTWAEHVGRWVAKGYMDTDTGEVLKQLITEQPVLSGIICLIVRVQMLTTLITSTTEIVGLDRQYDLLSKTTPHPAPPDNLIRSMMIDPARATENRLQLKRLGYDDTQIDNIILSHYALLDVGTIRTNYLRGNITAEKMYERMRELGYTDTRTKEIIQTWTLYPGPQDLFTMVAHEAFEPDIYGPLGLADEFPSAQVPWLEAQGISQEWAMKYWIAHWTQPSIGQGFEMLHRGVITRAELDMLFKVVEIPKFWRDKLMAITYNPYTRVDTRRMHELGVLSTEELVSAYQDIGYDAAKAVKMAEFTIRYNAEGDKQLTRSVILDSYRNDLISRSDAMDLMTSSGYSEDVADFYLTHEEYKQAVDIQKIHLGVIEDQWMENMISEAELRSRLNKLNLRGSKIDALMSQWMLNKYKSERLPTPSQLDDMLLAGVIDEGKWRSVMSRHGYSAQHQSWYLALIADYLATAAANPTKAELKTWYTKKLIDVAEYRRGMQALGYSDRNIDLYLKSM